MALQCTDSITFECICNEVNGMVQKEAPAARCHCVLTTFQSLGKKLGTPS